MDEIATGAMSTDTQDNWSLVVCPIEMKHHETNTTLDSCSSANFAATFYVDNPHMSNHKIQRLKQE